MKLLENKNDKGFSLVEVLVSMVVVSLLLICLVSAFRATRQLNSVASKRDQAINIASSLMEKLKGTEYETIADNTLEDNCYPLVLECTYDSDVNLAIQIMEEEILKNPLTINDSDKYLTSITCSNLNPNGFELKGIVWSNNVADNFKACSELRISIYYAWKKRGIEVPYNTITVLNE